MSDDWRYVQSDDVLYGQDAWHISSIYVVRQVRQQLPPNIYSSVPEQDINNFFNGYIFPNGEPATEVFRRIWGPENNKNNMEKLKEWIPYLFQLPDGSELINKVLINNHGYNIWPPELVQYIESVGQGQAPMPNLPNYVSLEQRNRERMNELSNEFNTNFRALNAQYLGIDLDELDERTEALERMLTAINNFRLQVYTMYPNSSEEEITNISSTINININGTEAAINRLIDEIDQTRIQNRERGRLERLERERLERERLERERLERERLERETRERERLEREMNRRREIAERDRAERDRAERDQLRRRVQFLTPPRVAAMAPQQGNDIVLRIFNSKPVWNFENFTEFIRSLPMEWGVAEIISFIEYDYNFDDRLDLQEFNLVMKNMNEYLIANKNIRNMFEFFNARFPSVEGVPPIAPISIITPSRNTSPLFIDVDRNGNDFYNADENKNIREFIEESIREGEIPIVIKNYNRFNVERSVYYLLTRSYVEQMGSTILDEENEPDDPNDSEGQGPLKFITVYPCFEPNNFATYSPNDDGRRISNVDKRRPLINLQLLFSLRGVNVDKGPFMDELYNRNRPVIFITLTDEGVNVPTITTLPWATGQSRLHCSAGAEPEKIFKLNANPPNNYYPNVGGIKTHKSKKQTKRNKQNKRKQTKRNKQNKRKQTKQKKTNKTK
jgi:hypothetical protein